MRHKQSQSFYIVYIWGCTPDPVPKADIKTKKYYGIYAVILSEGNFPNPFRCPASSKRAGFRGIRGKKSRVKFSPQKTILYPPLLSNFLSLIANGDSPPSYSGEFLSSSLLIAA